MKKSSILMVSVSLVAIAVMVIGVLGSGAWFTDQEAVTGNNFVAGKIDLTMGQPQSLPFNIVDVKPGDSGTAKVRLTNTEGSLPADLSISLGNIIDSENDMIEPETQPVPNKTSDYAGNGGELDIFLGFAAFVDVNKDGTFNAGDIQLTYDAQQRAFPGFWGGVFHNSGLYSMVGPWSHVMTLAGGQSVDLVITWDFPTESTDGNYLQNIAMTDGLGFDIQAALEQVH